MMGLQSQGQAGPSWAGKRAVEEAEHARERCVDRMFTLRRCKWSYRIWGDGGLMVTGWVGDPMDESDMWKV